MIKSLVVTNHLGESITLELGAPEKSGLLVVNVDGLGPSKANINMTDMASNDGSLYTSARVTPRNIVMTLKMLWHPTIEDARQLTYKYFPLKKRIKITIHTDNRSAMCYGYVESNEPVIFSKEEHTQISIICPDPFLYSESPITTIFAGIDARFEFPFSNESLTEPLLEMSEMKTDTSEVITYDGDGNPGIVISIHALGPVEMLTIHNTDTRETLKLDTTRLETLTGYGII